MYHVFMVSANNNKNKCQFCQPDHLLASNSLVEAQVDVPCKQICFLAKIVCKTNMSKKRLVLFGLVFFHCCFIQIDTVLKISFPFCIAYVHKLLPQKKNGKQTFKQNTKCVPIHGWPASRFAGAQTRLIFFL